MWLSKQRPIYIGRKFFKQGVVDLAWSPDGRALLAASTDGSVACFQFSPDELGEPVPQAVSMPSPPSLHTHLEYITYGSRYWVNCEYVYLSAALKGPCGST